MIAEKRDANEREIITVARHAGAHVIQMDKSVGFDLLVIHRTGTHIIEVKNPERKWKLTPAEEACARRVDRTGQTYNVVEYGNDLLEMFEGKKSKSNHRKGENVHS